MGILLWGHKPDGKEVASDQVALLKPNLGRPTTKLGEMELKQHYVKATIRFPCGTDTLKTSFLAHCQLVRREDGITGARS